MQPTLSLARALRTGPTAVRMGSAAFHMPGAALRFSARTCSAPQPRLRAVQAPPPALLPHVRHYSDAGPPSREDITKRVFNIFYGFEKADDAKVVPEAYLEADLGLDSLDVMEVLLELEHEFSLLIEDEDALQIETVKDLIDYVASVPQGTLCWVSPSPLPPPDPMCGDPECFPSWL